MGALLLGRVAQPMEDIMNPTEPYTVKEFYTVVEEMEKANDKYQCNGKCRPQGKGLVGDREDQEEGGQAVVVVAEVRPQPLPEPDRGCIESAL